MHDQPAPFPDLEQLSASERFQQALAAENPRLVRSAAAELPAIGIAEAAAMLLVIARTEPDNYERAALGWLAKLATESPRIDLYGITRAAEALDALPHRPTARATLAEVCRNAGDPRAASVFAVARRFRPPG
jgi:selenocysteine lyase/cysteine desulfurase